MKLEKRYSMSEVMSILKMSRPAVIGLITTGKLGSFRPGRNYFVLESQLQDYLQKVTNNVKIEA